MGAFEYRQAEDIRDAFVRHGVRYLFTGMSGALMHGFAEALPAVEVFAEPCPANGRAIVQALSELGFALSEGEAEAIVRGKDFVRLRNGPFDVDLVFAPDGIETFAEAWGRHVEVEGFPVCHLDDIIASKEATRRRKDEESLPRLRAFREYLRRRP